MHMRGVSFVNFIILATPNKTTTFCFKVTLLSGSNSVCKKDPHIFQNFQIYNSNTLIAMNNELIHILFE